MGLHFVKYIGLTVDEIYEMWESSGIQDHMNFGKFCDIMEKAIKNKLK